MTFDPAYPPVSNSLNRFKIWQLPGFPQEKYGWAGYDLLSSAALTRAIKERSAALAIDPKLSEGELHQAYFQRIESDHASAIQIAEQMGYYLGYILLVLHRGDQANRDGNPEKDLHYWDYWSQVRTIFLGGGLSSGRMGHILAKSAASIVKAHISDYTIQAIDNARHCAILGAARYVMRGDQAIIFDFGNTLLKRGRAYYSDAGLCRLQLFESVPFGYGLTVSEDDTEAIFERFVDLIVEAYQEGDSPDIAASIASYVAPDGQPYKAQGGIYMHMSQLGDSLPNLLSHSVSERIGKRVTIKLIHDGTAAASFYSPLERAAVITLGTAIGSGYPVPRPNLRAIAPALQVI